MKVIVPRLALVSILILLRLLSFAQFSEDYVSNFDMAKHHLAKGRLDKAVKHLEHLYQLAPKNHNINYLLGLCYTESPHIKEEAIQLLEYASESAKYSYDPSSHKEVDAPIFVYYYLTIAYSQQMKCTEAHNSFQNFHRLYGSTKNDFYVRDGKHWLTKCAKEEITERVAELPIPKSENPKKEIKNMSVVTKNVHYTTQAPIYGVQVGAYSKLIPMNRFMNLKNIEGFLDSTGTIRYVIGHFTIQTQAENLLQAIVAKGYTDAFIVDVNKHARFEEELIIADNKSVKKKAKRYIEFSVQIGAFKDSIPDYLVNIYLQLEGISELRQGEFNLMTYRRFESYEMANMTKGTLQDFDLYDAFVIAIEDGRKIPVQDAIKYFEEMEFTRNEKEAD